MRRHLNTLYVTTEGAYARKDGANVVVEVDDAERLRVPAHMIGGIVLFGRTSLSPALMGFCLEEGIAITHLSEHGRFLARVEGPVSGNVLLRRAQYRAAEDPEKAARITRSMVLAKTVNQRAVVRRTLRDHGGAMDDPSRASLEAAEARLSDIARRIERPAGVDGLRGLEGEASAVYFGVFDAFIRKADPFFRFEGRSRRPPLDPVNALLSFLYTLLTHDCRSALETVGLDPASGFLHALRPGRPSLALDLLEEFRPHLADRLALSLINRGQVGPSAFRRMDNGAVLLTEDGRKTVLVAWQERKKEELLHPFIEEKVSIGLLPHLQAQLLARHLRGDLDGYPPMIWK
ncbi:type I-C CRISPR-associated endonuclease Cas1c [Microvirga thermotolerans]|uniref:CRISPR-associated endonuclease Cas1 n=1 Tax=Microvirga thermotolerans TaxID=2651334 RepID=A0A5P9JWM7_9HYPH|nr:type I-C CRISPR-associated endonuclease Cas1c [Microvirga thermotolerans]QFU15605.1 type I-C CRISPR-associated endonuclease Cas1 [Microvirga thermotolerans]